MWGPFVPRTSRLKRRHVMLREVFAANGSDWFSDSPGDFAVLALSKMHSQRFSLPDLLVKGRMELTEPGVPARTANMIETGVHAAHHLHPVGQATQRSRQKPDEQHHHIVATAPRACSAGEVLPLISRHPWTTPSSAKRPAAGGRVGLPLRSVVCPCHRCGSDHASSGNCAPPVRPSC